MNPERIYREHRDDALARQATSAEYSTFVAMPFEESDQYQSKTVFRELICAAAARANEQRGELRPFATPRRVDDNAGVAVVVTEEIIVDILESHFVVADLTMVNVGAILEAGAALGLKPNRQIILLYNGDYKKLHFDIRNNRVIKYSSNDDKGAIEEIAQAFLAAARSFEGDRQRYVDFIKSSLSPDAVQWLKQCAILWHTTPERRPSLHRGILDTMNGGSYKGDHTASLVFISGTNELVTKRLLKTEYNVRP